MCRYLLNAALNFFMSHLRIVTVGGKLLKIFMPVQNVLLWKQNKLAFGLWRLCLFLVLILCIDEFVWKISWLLTMKLINESVCWHGTGRISSCLNRLLHEVLGSAQAIILRILFCKVRIFPLLGELLHKIHIL